MQEPAAHDDHIGAACAKNMDCFCSGPTLADHFEITTPFDQLFDTIPHNFVFIDEQERRSADTGSLLLRHHNLRARVSPHLQCVGRIRREEKTCTVIISVSTSCKYRPTRMYLD